MTKSVRTGIIGRPPTNLYNHVFLCSEQGVKDELKIFSRDEYFETKKWLMTVKNKDKLPVIELNPDYQAIPSEHLKKMKWKDVEISYTHSWRFDRSEYPKFWLKLYLIHPFTLTT